MGERHSADWYVCVQLHQGYFYLHPDASCACGLRHCAQQMNCRIAPACYLRNNTAYNLESSAHCQLNNVLSVAAYNLIWSAVCHAPST